MEVMEEWFPLVDEEGRCVGKATRTECHNGSMRLHPVVHLHIFNKKGELHLQKRVMSKDIQPDKWDTAVGGHVDLDESIADALRREVREELGIEHFLPEFVARYVYRSGREQELVYTFKTEYEGPFTLNPEEIDEGHFWSREELTASIGHNLFTPNLEHELQLVLHLGIKH